MLNLALTILLITAVVLLVFGVGRWFYNRVIIAHYKMLYMRRDKKIYALKEAIRQKEKELFSGFPPKK
jgi:hypothetical protein